VARDEDRLWDPDDAVGYGPHSGAHRWSHEWMFWLSAACALAGVFGLIGAVRPFSVLRVVAALGILAGVLTLKRADRGSSGRWLALTLLLVAGGATVFVLDS
jgi:hypothetical protein